MFRRVSVVPLVPRVSVHRINNGRSIYKVGPNMPTMPTIKENEQFETMKDVEYTYLEPTAPPAPWYFYVYHTEVITKAETMKHWKLFPVDQQKFFLDWYMNLYINNILE